MRKTIRFSRLFTVAAVFSTLLISGGIAGFIIKGGFNLGVDFRSGMVQEVRFAPTAFTLTWNGAGDATLSADRAGVYIVNSGNGIQTRTFSFLFDEYPTVADLTGAMTAGLPGLSADILVPGTTASQWLSLGAMGDPRLGGSPLRIHYLDPDAEEIQVAAVRNALEAGLGNASVVVQGMEQPGDRHFLVRIQLDAEESAAAETALEVPAETADATETTNATEVADGAEVTTEVAETTDITETADMVEVTDVTEPADTTEPAVEQEAAGVAPVPDASAVSAGRITEILEAAFGQGEVMVLRSDFVDSRFAGDLTDQIGVLILATLLLVLLYASIRFRLQYAVGAVLGIAHDGIVVVAFIAITGMEFNTTSIAAILTILGYSTNNTIVVFDRIRENRRLHPDDAFIGILDRSLTETLNRTIITTVSTMLAVLSLFLFTTGAMKDFAAALMVGMVSGVYTTTFIVTGFMTFWEKRKTEKAKREFSTAGKLPGKAARA